MGVGFPATLLLHEFGSQVWSAFGHPPYHVGSSMPAINKTGWRDVDVRLILDDEEYEAMGLGDPAQPQQNTKWCAICLAWSIFGQQLTGLPIDFQIQQQTHANKAFDGARSAIGITALRLKQE